MMRDGSPLLDLPFLTMTLVMGEDVNTKTRTFQSIYTGAEEHVAAYRSQRRRGMSTLR